MRSLRGESKGCWCSEGVAYRGNSTNIYRNKTCGTVTSAFYFSTFSSGYEGYLEFL